jgi:hypothetical protein
MFAAGQIVQHWVAAGVTHHEKGVKVAFGHQAVEVGFQVRLLL